MISSKKCVKFAAFTTGLTLGVAAVSVPSGAADRSGAATFVKHADAICRSATKAGTALSGKTGATRSKDKKTLPELARRVEQTASKLKGLKPPKAKVASYKKGIRQMQSGAVLIEHFSSKLSHLTAKERRLFASSLEAIRTRGVNTFDMVGLRACASVMTSGTRSGPNPVLEASVLYAPGFTTSGYGSVRPPVIATSGVGGTNEVINITWQSWGGPTARGTGTGCVLQGTGIEANCARTPAEVVAYGLKTCGGKPAYLAVTWYFPSLGQTFKPNPVTSLTCPAASSTTTTTTVPPTATTVPPTTTTVPPTTTTVPSTPATTAATAPCTAPAITAALKSGGATYTYTLNDFGCSGAFAWATLAIQTSGNTYGNVVPLMAVNGGWEVLTSRSPYCTDGAVPASIHYQVCTTQ